MNDTMMKSSVVVIILAAAIIGSVFFAINNYLVQDAQIQELDKKLNNLEQAYADLKAELDGLPGQMAPDRMMVPELTTPPTTEPTPTPTPEPEPEYLEFRNPQFPYSFMHPRNWTQDTVTRRGNAIITFQSPDRKICNDIKSTCYAEMSLFIVEVDANPSSKDLDTYFNKAVVDLQNEYSITSTSKSPTTYISDVKAYGINYVTRDARGNPDKQVMQYYMIVDDKAYILTYSAPYSIMKDNMYDMYQRDAVDIVQSFNVSRVYKPVITAIPL